MLGRMLGQPVLQGRRTARWAGYRPAGRPSCRCWAGATLSAACRRGRPHPRCRAATGLAIPRRASCHGTGRHRRRRHPAPARSSQPAPGCRTCRTGRGAGARRCVGPGRQRGGGPGRECPADRQRRRRTGRRAGPGPGPRKGRTAGRPACVPAAQGRREPARGQGTHPGRTGRRGPWRTARPAASRRRWRRRCGWRGWPPRAPG